MGAAPYDMDRGCGRRAIRESPLRGIIEKVCHSERAERVEESIRQRNGEGGMLRVIRKIWRSPFDGNAQEGTACVDPSTSPQAASLRMTHCLQLHKLEFMNLCEINKNHSY